MKIVLGSRYQARGSVSGSSMMVRSKSRELRPTSRSRSSTSSLRTLVTPLAPRAASRSAYSSILSVAHARAAPKCACNTLCRAGELPKALKLGGVSSWAGSG